jgi:hypothetical protein
MPKAADEGRVSRRCATRKRPSPALRAASPGAGEAKIQTSPLPQAGEVDAEGGG